MSSCGADIGAFAVSLAVRSGSCDDIMLKEFPISDLDTLHRELAEFRGRVVPSVGSGAWRLAKGIESSTGALVEKHREPVCIWSAIEYLLGRDSDEAYKFVYESSPAQAKYAISAPFPSIDRIIPCQSSVSLSELRENFPLLLVNVKSGTSFYRIESPTEFERVGGSSIGAATVTGIGASLFGLSESVTKIAMDCSPAGSRCDLLVEDIYGGDCTSIGLAGSVIASCLGKGGRTELTRPEIAKSVVDMATMNTAQLTNLHAKLHACKMALVVGAIGESESEQIVVSECMQRVLNILGGENVLPAVFFKKSRYLGCLGALLRREQLLMRLSSGSESPSTLMARTSTPINTATMVDYVIDETVTKLRLSPRGGR